MRTLTDKEANERLADVRTRYMQEDYTKCLTAILNGGKSVANAETEFPLAKVPSIVSAMRKIVKENDLPLVVIGNKADGVSVILRKSS